jgi:hypothetical protein
MRSNVMLRRALSALVVLVAVLAVAPRAGAQWVDLGQGLAGTSGTPAVLTGFGPLLPTAGTKVSLAGGLPSGTGTLVVGLSNISASFKGGVIVPHPDFFLPMALDGSGAWQIIFSWPTDIPAGFLLYWQAWMPDPGGPKGFAASNALESTAS